MEDVACEGTLAEGGVLVTLIIRSISALGLSGGQEFLPAWSEGVKPPPGAGVVGDAVLLGQALPPTAAGTDAMLAPLPKKAPDFSVTCTVSEASLLRCALCSLMMLSCLIGEGDIPLVIKFVRDNSVGLGVGDDVRLEGGCIKAGEDDCVVSLLIGEEVKRSGTGTPCCAEAQAVVVLRTAIAAAETSWSDLLRSIGADSRRNSTLAEEALLEAPPWFTGAKGVGCKPPAPPSDRGPGDAQRGLPWSCAFEEGRVSRYRVTVGDWTATSGRVDLLLAHDGCAMCGDVIRGVWRVRCDPLGEVLGIAAAYIGWGDALA